MELLHLKDFIGNLAVVTTILQFLSGTLVCRQYAADMSTGEASSLPFVSCILSCSLWSFYGISCSDDRIVLVNFVGIILMSGYTVVFYIYTRKKALVVKQCLATAVLLFIVLSYSYTMDDKDQLLNVLGILASIFTLATIAAPMIKLLHVIKMKNAECLPFPIILMSFLVSSLWMMYGHIIHDHFLENVNVVGAGLALAQLSLFLIYPRTPPSPILPKNI